ncbi:MAG: helix-turn-helix transcriptional regulator [Leptospirales bacterium]
MTELCQEDYRSILEIVNLLYQSTERACLFQNLWKPLREIFGLDKSIWIPSDCLTQPILMEGDQVFNCPLESVSWPEAQVAQFRTEKWPGALHDGLTPAPLPDAPIPNRISLTLSSQGELLGTLEIHRPKTGPDFSNRERLMAELLLPHLTNALRILSLREEDDWCNRIGFVLIGPDRCMRFINQAASQMLSGDGTKMVLDLLFATRSLFWKTSSGVFRVHPLPVERIHSDIPFGEQIEEHSRMFLIEPFPPQKPLESRLDGFDLTPRQKEVLLKAIQGDSNRKIAKDLAITEQTVKDHIHDILEKLHVQNRSELITKLLGNGEKIPEMLSP